MSFDSVEDQKKFTESEGFPYTLLSDSDKTMGAAYEACREEGEKYFEAGLPRRISYLISPDGKIAKHYATVKPDEHSAQVLADLKELGAGP